jgi:hypothetical protein
MPIYSSLLIRFNVSQVGNSKSQTTRNAGHNLAVYSVSNDVSLGKFKSVKTLKLINVPFASTGGVDYRNVNES